MKVKFVKKDIELDVKEVLQKTVKPFSKASAHIILPKRLVGKEVFIAIED